MIIFIICCLRHGSRGVQQIQVLGRAQKFGNRCYMSFHVFIPMNFRLFCAQAYDLSQCGPTTGQGPHVARHSVFCGLQKHSGKIFKSEICWKACEVTFVSLNCLCWIMWIMDNIPFLCNILFYLFILKPNWKAWAAANPPLGHLSV